MKKKPCFDIGMRICRYAAGADTSPVYCEGVCAGAGDRASGASPLYSCRRFLGKKLDIHRAYDLISESEDRNAQIIEDVLECISTKRTPVILTKLKKHARFLYDRLCEKADHVFLLYGDNTQTQNQEIRRQMLDVPKDKRMIVIATGQKIGEGFDCPRLDALMLASPVKFDGRLIQYVGRLNRNYEGKCDVVVYDYVDAHIGIFDNQYRNRLAAYM